MAAGIVNPYDFKAIGQPEINDQLVKITLNAIQAIIDHIKKFPIIHPEEVCKK